MFQVVFIIVAAIGLGITASTLGESDDDFGPGLPFPQLPIMVFLGTFLIFVLMMYCSITCTKARYNHTCSRRGESIWC